MPIATLKEKGKYILLEGLRWKNRFFTTANPNDPHPEKLVDGTVAYKVLGYADTIADAQFALYGYRSTERSD